MNIAAKNLYNPAINHGREKIHITHPPANNISSLSRGTSPVMLVLVSGSGGMLAHYCH